MRDLRLITQIRFRRLMDFDGGLAGLAGFEVAFGDEHDTVNAEAQTLQEPEPVAGSVSECGLG